MIRDIDVETGQVQINMDLVAKEVGEQHIVCRHNVKGSWSWSYSPRTGLLYIPFNRSCLNQTANDRSVTGAGPRFTIPEPGLEEDGDLTELRAIDISTGREAWRYSQRAPNAGSALATGGDLVFHGDLNRRLRASVCHRAGRRRGDLPDGQLRPRTRGADRQQHAGDIRAAALTRRGPDR